MTSIIVGTFAGAILFAASVSAGCGGGGPEADQRRTGGTVSRGFRVHRDKGIELQVPEAWTVAVDAKTRRIEIAGDGARAVIWPLFAQATSGVDEGAVVRHLAKRLWPAAAWQPAAGTGVLRARLDGRTVAALAASNASPSGTAIVFYAIDAPTQMFDTVAGNAIAAFSSFRLAGAGEAASAGAPRPTFTRWRDPREGAFSVEVPDGWKVEGGTFRFAAVDVRPLVDVRSPDGAIVVRIGDPQLPTFTEPMPFFPEGSTYSPGYGVSMGVRRVMSGRAFASEYVRSAVAGSCGDVRIVDSRDREDAVRQINAIYQQYGLAAGMNAGDVTFTCGGRQGYYYAGIQVTRMGGPAMWRAENLLGYVAAPDRTAQAHEILARMMSSFRIDEGWMARQQQTTMATAAIVTRTNDVISKTIADTYWSKQPIESEISRRRSNAILGVEDVVDEHTGRHYRVESGSEYYWINPKGTIAGTDIDAAPRGDFRQLTIR